MTTLHTVGDHCAPIGPDGTAGRVPANLHARLRLKALAWGAVAALLLLAGYVGLVSAANSFGHAVDEFVRLWYWMAPLIAGFGLQAGLFTYGRGAAKAGATPHASGVVASGGASTVSMAACCAHHVADVLPLLGLAGAGLFLSQYQSLFLLLGVLSNAVGAVYLLSRLSRHGQYPERGGVLAALLNRSWRRAVPLALGGAVLTMSIATTATLW